MQGVLPVEDGVSKELAALHRAIPQTRMWDYGMAADDAATMSALTVNDSGWVQTAESLAETRLIRARSSRSGAQCRIETEQAAAAFNIAQLAFTKDVPAKIRLYQRAGEALDEAVDQSGGTLSRFTSLLHGRVVYGWEMNVKNSIGGVIIIGGLSGWGASYLGMARSLAGQGIGTLMAEVPGQGDTRMRSGIHLSLASLSFVDAFVDSALSYGRPIGVIGNSFGGLIAAHIAAAESRISACCINGAAPRISVPEYRMVREQMEAAFACEGAELAGLLEELTFDPGRTPIDCPTLILEGGADPIVAPGVQAGFLSSSPRAGSTVRCWADGEHTIYNHASERNAFLAGWFHQRFTQPSFAAGITNV